MKANDVVSELAVMTRVRPLRLKQAKEKGKKVIEFTGSFIPEEMIYAAGAEPYFMCRGGEPEPPDAVLPYMLRFMNPQARSLEGYGMLGLDPVTPLADLIVAQQTDCHVGRISELMEYMKLPVYKVGVPPDWTKPFAAEYYYRALEKLKAKLEEMTGNSITDGALRSWIEKFQHINSLLAKIAEMRKGDAPPISSLDFIKLNHATFFVDPDVVLEKLIELVQALKGAPSVYAEGAPRLLLAGRVVAQGDYTVPRVIEELGGAIVCEWMDEGLRHFEAPVTLNGDLIRSLGETIYLKRRPQCIFQPVWKDRFEIMKQLIAQYRIQGVVWYQLSFDEIYDMECSCLAKWLGEMGMPMIKLESSYEYSREAMGPLTTRIESFLETVKAKH